MDTNFNSQKNEFEAGLNVMCKEPSNSSDSSKNVFSDSAHARASHPFGGNSESNKSDSEISTGRSSGSASVRNQNSERGATMLEYGVMVALIVVGCMATVSSLGGKTLYTYEDVMAQAGFEH